MKIYIYGLIDPRPEYNHIRYVGKSYNPNDRYKSHLSEWKKVDRNYLYKNRWIKKLLDKGYEPILTIIEEVNKDNWSEREIYWISYYRKKYDHLLTNIAIGGQGPSGWKHTEKTKQKMKSYIRTEEHKRKLSESLKGNKYPNRKKYIMTKKHLENLRNSNKLNDNSHPKNWKLISPIGEEYIISKGLRKFTTEHNLSYDMIDYYKNKGTILQKNYQKNKSTKAKNTVGWKIESH